MGLDLLAIRLEVESLSREVGDWIHNQKVERSDIEFKSLNNLVSFVDKQAEERFVAGLKDILPEAGFVAEEGSADHSGQEYIWIVDPLDGTTNFLHNIPMWCTSVALARNGHSILGVIYSPHQNELFSAHEKGGSTLNGLPIQVSNNAKLSDSLLATGFPYDDFGRQEAYMELLKQLCQDTRGLRRVGSAAIDLAWTACGRFEAFYEYGLNPWDVAAGIAIVRESGGNVTTFKKDGDPLYGEEILASNTLIHDELRDIINQHFS